MTTRYLSPGTFVSWARNDILADEPLVTTAIQASEEYIDSRSGRSLVLAVLDGADETADVTRQFRPDRCSTSLWIPDMAEVSSVTEDGTLLVAGDDYQAEPFDNLDRASNSYRPFDRLVRLDRYWYTNGARPTVEVVGKPGWTSIPAAVIEACCILTNDWLTNRDVRLGVVGSDESGFSIGVRQNPYVMAAIDTIRGANSWGIA